MQETKVKEDISISYLSALCAYAGISYERIIHDDDSTDGILKKRVILDDKRKYDASLRIQLKCLVSIVIGKIQIQIGRIELFVDLYIQ